MNVTSLFAEFDVDYIKYLDLRGSGPRPCRFERIENPLEVDVLGSEREIFVERFASIVETETGNAFAVLGRGGWNIGGIASVGTSMTCIDSERRFGIAPSS